MRNILASLIVVIAVASGCSAEPVNVSVSVPEATSPGQAADELEPTRVASPELTPIPDVVAPTPTRTAGELAPDPTATPPSATPAVAEPEPTVTPESLAPEPSSGADAIDPELMQEIIDSEFAGFTRVQIEDPIEINFGADLSFAAFALLIGERIEVRPQPSCDLACVDAIAAQIRTESDGRPFNFGSGEIGLVESDCGFCQQFRLLALVDDGQGGYNALQRKDFLAAMVPIDTGYEAMIAYGSQIRVRQLDGGWQGVAAQTIADCDPIITRVSLFAFNADAGADTEILATLDQVQNGVCY